MKNFFLQLGAAFLLILWGCGDAGAAKKKGIDYVDASTLTIINKAFPATANPWQRVDSTDYPEMTAKVKNLYSYPSGISVVFRTNSPGIYARWTTGGHAQSSNIPAIAQRGLDLYIMENGRWVYAGVGKPSTDRPARSSKGNHGTEHSSAMCVNMDTTMKVCMVNLPIYDRLLSLEIGVDKGSTIAAARNPYSKRVLIAGSSITNGSGVSRPGMAYPGRIGRELMVETPNLGASGNFRLEPFFAEIVGDVEADAFVFDAFSNPSAEQIRERLVPFVERVRRAHPEAPLIFINTLVRPKGNFNLKVRGEEEAKRRAAEEMMAKVTARFADVYFINPGMPLGEGSDATVDGIHPTDMGFDRILGTIMPQIKRILGSYGIPRVANAPIMGWSSWNTYRVNISDSLIMAQADALVATGLKDCGYGYINIDDGFFGYRDSTGMMQPHPERFPGGMRRVADHIHSLGLKAGIYSDAGANTCGLRWDNDLNGLGAGLYGHEREDARRYFKDWGFDFIKIDYCGAGQELNLDEERRYREIRRAFEAEGCGDVAINICRWTFPGTWAADIAGSWRISPDITPDWGSVRSIIARNMYLSGFCSPGHYNDMDMLEIGRGLAPNEEEVHFAMWCMMSSPLLIGCDLTKLPAASLELLSNPELIALNQDRLGLQARVEKRCGAGYVLAKDVETRMGNKRALAFYNPSESACDFSMSTAEAGFEGKVRLRDLVRRRDLGTAKGSLDFTVPARSVLVVMAEGERRREPERYEAEWAYLPCYDALGKTDRAIGAAPCEGASGGVVVENIGGRQENSIRWTDVWSRNGGRYTLTINYMPAPRRSMSVDVNGTATTLTDLATTGGIASISLPIDLRPGFNTIEIGSAYAWAPDIDNIILEYPFSYKNTTKYNACRKQKPLQL